MGQIPLISSYSISIISLLITCPATFVINRVRFYNFSRTEFVQEFIGFCVKVMPFRLQVHEFAALSIADLMQVMERDTTLRKRQMQMFQF